MVDFRYQQRKLFESLRNRGVKSKILDAIKKSPRHLFIPKHLQAMAYEDIPLSIGFSATISQPYTVAFMLQELEIEPGQKILEIGAGSGWNASLLSILVGKKGKIYTIEFVKELAGFSRANLKDYPNVEVIHGDGSKGYKEKAPFDRIIATVALPKILQHLIDQLKDPGIFLAPVGDEYSQELLKVKKEHLQIRTEHLGYFQFVPLKGKYGFRY